MIEQYYVYALYREDGITPFYIGKGRGTRWLHHEKWADRSNTHKNNVIKKLKSRGLPIKKRKLAECLTNAAASALEVKLIKKYGRWPEGPLTNKTEGGDGTPGFHFSPSLKRKLSNIQKAAWANPALRKSQSEGAKEWLNTPEACKHRSESASKRKMCRRARRERSVIAKLFWQDPQKRANLLEGHRKSWTPERRMAHSENMRRPEVRRARSRKQKSLYRDPVRRAFLLLQGRRAAHIRWHKEKRCACAIEN
jgi:hypothetical protein